MKIVSLFVLVFFPKASDRKNTLVFESKPPGDERLLSKFFPGIKSVCRNDASVAFQVFFECGPLRNLLCTNINNFFRKGFVLSPTRRFTPIEKRKTVWLAQSDHRN